MATFASFMDTLPDPINKIGVGGNSDPTTGAAGAGFAGVSLSSVEPYMKSTTNADRTSKDRGLHHNWDIKIDYNPMTCDEFYPVFSFLGYKRATLQPFFVSVPPFSDQAITNKTIAETPIRGQEAILVTGTGVTAGSIFRFDVSTKIYMVTRVETSSEYNTQDTAPGGGEERLHITPSIQTDITIGDTLIFTDPKFYVIQSGNTTQYSIDTKNLYAFGLDLEEVHA